MNDVLAYITCPKCRRQIREPFSRLSGPVVYVHDRPNRSKCRLVIHPDKMGNDHRVYEVPEDMSLESALVKALAA